MSEIDADLDRAAAAYWMSVASKAGTGKTLALEKARTLLRDANAEARIPDSGQQPTLNDLVAPPVHVPRGRRLKR
jgi:hypothetical protein